MSVPEIRHAYKNDGELIDLQPVTYASPTPFCKLELIPFLLSFGILFIFLDIF